MLRVAVSISEGEVVASTVIRRLGSHGIRNSLFYAFIELGRIVRTQFLLDYISNIELRETLQAAICTWARPSGNSNEKAWKLRMRLCVVSHLTQ